MARTAAASFARYRVARLSLPSIEHVGVEQEVEGGARGEPDGVAHDRDVRCQGGQGIRGRVDLGPPDIGGPEHRLPVQVAGVDGVVVDDRDGADSGGRERGDDRAAEAAGADDDHMRIGEALLGLAPESGEHALAGVARVVGVDGHASILSQRRDRRCEPHARLQSMHANADAAMNEFSVREAAVLLGVSDDTVRRWADNGRLRIGRGASGRQVIAGTELVPLLAELARGIAARRHLPCGEGSARNRFTGIVTAVTRDGVMAQVELQAGPFRVVSLMSREAADELGLEPGVLASASAKATVVTIEVPENDS